VKVTGTGLSNYAVTKDDLGNWYVKAVSVDSTVITDTATNLGLFNLGLATAAATSVASSSAKTKSGNSPSDSSAAEGQTPSSTAPASGSTNNTGAGGSGKTATTTPSSGVQKIIDKYQQDYTATTKADLTRALKLDTDFSNAINAAWPSASDLKTMTTLEQAAFKKFNKDLQSEAGALKTKLAALQPSQDSSKAAPSTDSGSLIVQALTDVKDSYGNLVSAMKADQADPGSTTSAVAKATQAIRQLLTQFIASREATVKAFSTAVSITGEAVN
jgi:hypothetical protein